jgi:antibiotic biosynthesis monooxygenase (ABM) superfamily enzyme
MVIYEVNIEVAPTIEREFELWLREHVAEMEELDGVRAPATIYAESSESTKLSIHYRFADLSALEHYFEHMADEMRGRLPNEMRSHLQFSRRVLKPYEL